MEKNINSNQNGTINEAWEKIGKIFSEGLDNRQQIFILLKVIELLNTEINTSNSTKTALIEKNNAVLYGNKNNDKQALILKYVAPMKKAKKIVSDIVLPYIINSELLTPSDLETFKLHYIDGIPFSQMYEFIPKDGAEINNTNKCSQKKKYNYANCSDRSNMNKKLLATLRGFKSRKPKSAKEDYTGAEEEK